MRNTSNNMNQTETEDQRDTSWSSYTAKVSFGALGVFSGCSDGTDINSVDRDPGGGLMVAADDFGKVRSDPIRSSM